MIKIAISTHQLSEAWMLSLVYMRRRSSSYWLLFLSSLNGWDVLCVRACVPACLRF